MKTKKYKKNRLNKTVIAVSIILVLIITATTYSYISKSQTPALKQPTVNSPIVTIPATPKEIKDSNAIKQNSVNNETTDNSTPPLSASITSINQNDPTLQIRVLVQKISNTGSCKLTLTQGSISKVYSVDIQALASNSTCKGFDIPITDLGTTGEWAATIVVTIDTQTVKLTQNISIK